MERYETKIKYDHINRLTRQGRYEEAIEIANTIDWDKMRNFDMLCRVAEVYERCGYYEDSKAIYNRAYQLNPDSRIVVYRLTELSIKLREYDDSIYFYDQYEKIAPYDVNLYVLRYKIYRARGASTETLISVLEQLNENDYHEHWAYELAKLYAQSGQIEKCIHECDEIYLWFGNGRYVTKALRLKQRYGQLTKEQQEKLEEAGIRPAKMMETIRREEEAKKKSMQLQQQFERTEGRDPDREKVRDAAIAASREARAAMLLAEAQQEEQQENLEEEAVYDREILGVVPFERLDMELPEMEETPELDLYNVNGDVLARQVAQILAGEPVDEEDKKALQSETSYIHKMQESITEPEDERVEDIKIAPVSTTRYSTVDLQKELANSLNTFLGKEGLLESIDQEDKELVGESTERNVEKELRTSYSSIAKEEPKKKIEEEEIQGQISLFDFFGQEEMEDEEMRPETQEAVQEAKAVLRQTEVTKEELVAMLQKLTGILAPDEDQNFQEAEEELSENKELLNNPTTKVPTIEEVMDEVAATAGEEDKTDEKGEIPEEDEDDGEVVEEEAQEDLNAEKLGELSGKQKELLSYFLDIEEVGQQIDTFIQKTEDDRGNFLITGPQGSGKLSLATRMVKAIAAGLDISPGRLAKLDGDVLNRKPLETVWDKVGEGTLLIVHGEHLTESTSEKLAGMMEEYAGKMRVIVLGEKAPLQELMEKTPKLKDRFSLWVDLPVYSSDDLVAFGKRYALSKGYVIDEIAVLALYTRLSGERNQNKAVMLGELKEIIDEAIADCEAKKGMKKFFGGLFGSNIDKDGNIILKEENFGVDA